MFDSNKKRPATSNLLTRRKFASKITLLTAAMSTAPKFLDPHTVPAKRPAMGLAAASYANRWGSGDASKKIPGFEHALQMLIHCESIGAGGVQVGTKNWSEDFAGRVRDYREKKELYLEGSIKLPQNDADIERFRTEAMRSSEAGAKILRTVCLYGRRYENFETGQAFELFKETSIKSIERAEPVLNKLRLKLAIENHKDWQVPDLLALMKHLDSEWIGVTLDTGNNISLLEDPMYVVESLAPYAFTTHLKDMGVKEYEDGFLLSEVPLGTGVLDLRSIIDVCRKYNPNIIFNLEMITRNPLKIPCFTDQY